MHIKTFVKIFSLLVACAISHFAFGADDEKYAVLNSWEKGGYTLRQDCTNTLIKTVDGTEAGREESKLLFTWQIDASSETADGVQMFNLKMLRVMMRIRSNGRDQVYFDSSNGKDKSEILNAVFARMKNSAIVVIFKNGTPAEVQGCENFWKDLPEPKDENEKNLLLNVQTLAAADNIKQTFETLTYLDSSKKVGVGDSWNSHTVLQIPLVGEKSFEWDCALNSIKKGADAPLANVSGKGKMEFDVNAQIKCEVKMEGDVVYDTRACYPTSVVSRVFVSINRNSDDADGKHLEVYSGFTKNNLSVAKH